jgi:hypothetical protein
MNKNTLSAVTLGLLLLSVAAGIIVWQVTGEVIGVALCTMLLIFGIGLFALSFLDSGVPGKFGPSEATYKLVIGIIIAVFGTAGLLNIFTDLNIWILVAIVIIAIAVLGIAVALTNGKKEAN